ncbi:cell division protein FtsZ [Salinibius halmophilus]|uniref:cell division protein FtsZ n=1 Tax=Salinibius halmophilus TaxID=1853216 RepID=UPI001F31DD05|nr:cell division protein FtsZ [Salinibius halmophilus]
MQMHDNDLKNDAGPFGFAEEPAGSAVIKVIGVGGGGGNAVTHMVRNQIPGVEFICANTDAQVINNLEGALPLQLGGAITRGLGAGANPEKGRQAALEDKERIMESLEGANMVFITAGMGGGTGTGAAPVVAELARELGILTVAVVTKPFSFEGSKRTRISQAGLEALSERVDSLIVIENDKLLEVLGDDVGLLEAFAAADNVLLDAVQGISDLIIRPGLINVDFADVETTMRNMGLSMMGVGVAAGEDRAERATEQALRSPLLQDVDLRGAKGVLVNVTAGTNLGLREFTQVGDLVRHVADDNGEVIIGTAIDPDLKDELRVTVVATGIGQRDEDELTEAPQVVAENPEVQAPRKRLDTIRSETQASSRPMRPAKDARPDVRVSESSEPQQQAERPSRRAATSSSSQDVLDIPTFLRRQAD